MIFLVNFETCLQILSHFLSVWICLFYQFSKGKDFPILFLSFTLILVSIFLKDLLILSICTCLCKVYTRIHSQNCSLKGVYYKDTWMKRKEKKWRERKRMKAKRDLVKDSKNLFYLAELHGQSAQSSGTNLFAWRARSFCRAISRVFFSFSLSSNTSYRKSKVPKLTIQSIDNNGEKRNKGVEEEEGEEFEVKPKMVNNQRNTER